MSVTQLHAREMRVRQDFNRSLSKLDITLLDGNGQPRTDEPWVPTSPMFPRSQTRNTPEFFIDMASVNFPPPPLGRDEIITGIRITIDANMDIASEAEFKVFNDIGGDKPSVNGQLNLDAGWRFLSNQVNLPDYGPQSPYYLQWKCGKTDSYAATVGVDLECGWGFLDAVKNNYIKGYSSHQGGLDFVNPSLKIPAHELRNTPLEIGLRLHFRGRVRRDNNDRLDALAVGASVAGNLQVTYQISEPATLPSGYYTMQGQNGYVGGDSNTGSFHSAHANPQILWLESFGYSQYVLRGQGQEKNIMITDLGGGQYSLFDESAPNGPFVFADYNAGGVFNVNPNLIHDWWKFTIEVPPPSAFGYLMRYPDLQHTFGTNFADALKHYEDLGRADGRSAGPFGTCGDTGGLADLASNPFDPCWYLNHHADLKTAFSSDNMEAVYRHWIESGISEGRQSNANFSIKSYLSRYPDLVQAFGATNYSDAYNHWFQNGQAEGRDASP